MTALGIALVLTTSAETIIAAHFRNSGEGLYAADAVLERSLDDLLAAADWNQLLNGAVQSTFIDGPPSGSRALDDGSVIDLLEVLALATCQSSASCSGGDMDAVTSQRPWGVNNPRWQLYAYGNLREMMPLGTVNSPYYVVAMVGDDPSENDGNPLQDGSSEDNPGSGVLAIRAEAFDWHDRVELGNGAAVTLVPTRHWSARALFDRNKTLWASFVLETPAGKLYVVCDSGYGDGRHFRRVAQTHGPLRLAILPIGAYEPRWFMRDQHMNPSDAVKALADCGAERALAHHHGTFQLTDEAIDAPVIALHAALDEAKVPRERFVALKPGQVVEI